MEVDTDTILAGLRRLMAEEMFLLGRELEDSLDGSSSHRLEEVCDTLDQALELLAQHQAARPHG